MIAYKRGQGKYNSDVLFEDYYAWYVTNVSDPLPRKLFKAIFKDFIEAMMLEVIYHGYELNMPAKMGSILIREGEYKFTLNKDGELDTSRLAVNWKKTKDKWERLYPGLGPEELKAIKNKPLIYIENDHTDETIKKWCWNKLSCNFKYQSLYTFNATRGWDQILTKANKEKNITYHGLR